MQLHVATTDPGPALKSVVESQRPHATAKQHTIHLEVPATPAMALVDGSITVQVLETLPGQTQTAHRPWIRNLKNSS